MTDHLYDGDDYDSEMCRHCDGDGVILVCMDDLCRGAGQCFFEKPGCHGIAICKQCSGSGEVSA